MDIYYISYPLVVVLKVARKSFPQGPVIIAKDEAGRLEEPETGMTIRKQNLLDRAG